MSLALISPARGGRWPGEDPGRRAVGQATEVPGAGVQQEAGHQPSAAHHRAGPLPAGGRSPRCPQPRLALSSKPAWPCWPNDREGQTVWAGRWPQQHRRLAGWSWEPDPGVPSWTLPRDWLGPAQPGHPLPLPAAMPRRPWGRSWTSGWWLAQTRDRDQAVALAMTGARGGSSRWLQRGALGTGPSCL